MSNVDQSGAVAKPNKFKLNSPMVHYDRRSACPPLDSVESPSAAASPSLQLEAPRPYSRRWYRLRMEAKGFKFMRPQEPLPMVRILTEEEIGRGLALIGSRPASSVMNTVKFLLSFDAGLKVPEIAALQWEDLNYDEQGRYNSVFVRPRRANDFEARVLELTPRTAHALQRLRMCYPHVPFVAFTDRGHVKHQDKASLLHWMLRLYGSLGLIGAAGLSGPATYRAARNPELVSDLHRLWMERWTRAPRSDSPR